MGLGRIYMRGSARSVGKGSDRAFGGGPKNFFGGRVRRCGEVVGRLEGVERMCMGVGGGGFGASGVREGLRKVGVHWSLGVHSGGGGVKRSGGRGGRVFWRLGLGGGVMFWGVMG